MMGTCSSKLCSRLGGLILLAFSAWSFAQSAPPASSPSSQDQADTSSSLAAAARNSKAQKAGHAMKVITDEDMEAVAGPLPRLKMDGPDNADEVVAAIAKYKATHTPQQTEEAVHAWYDRYDQMLAAAIKESSDINTLRNVNANNGYDLCAESTDPYQCRSRQQVSMPGMRSDSNEMMKNSRLERRIQQAFSKVQGGLMMNGLRYDWFKIRISNGIDQF